MSRHAYPPGGVGDGSFSDRHPILGFFLASALVLFGLPLLWTLGMGLLKVVEVIFTG